MWLVTVIGQKHSLEWARRTNTTVRIARASVLCYENNRNCLMVTKTAKCGLAPLTLGITKLRRRAWVALRSQDKTYIAIIPMMAVEIQLMMAVEVIIVKTAEVIIMVSAESRRKL